MGCACVKKSEIIESKYIKKQSERDDFDEYSYNGFIIIENNREYYIEKIMEELVNGNGKISEESIVKIEDENLNALLTSSQRKNESKTTNCESPIRFNSTEKNIGQNKKESLKNKTKKAGPIITMLEKKNNKYNNRNKNKI